MTELENKLVVKIMEKLDMDKLTDKIAEKAAELIVQKEYPSTPITDPVKPWIAPGSIKPDHPFEDVVVAYGVPSSGFRPTCLTQNSTGDVLTGNENKVE